MQVRKPCGFDRSFQSLDSSSNIRPTFGATIRVPSSSPKTQFNISMQKHIELHMHFIRKLIHDQVIEVLFFPTKDQVADIFTKSLTEAKFSKLRSMLGVQEVVIKGG
jgi:hypothetical protein